MFPSGLTFFSSLTFSTRPFPISHCPINSQQKHQHERIPSVQDSRATQGYLSPHKSLFSQLPPPPATYGCADHQLLHDKIKIHVHRDYSFRRIIHSPPNTRTVADSRQGRLQIPAGTYHQPHAPYRERRRWLPCCLPQSQGK